MKHYSLLTIPASILLIFTCASCATSPKIITAVNSSAGTTFASHILTSSASENVSPVPVPKGPGYGCIVSLITPQLQWYDSVDSASYQIQLATDRDFANVVLDANNIVKNFYTVPAATLTWETAYYWRVRAENNTGISEWSAVWYFAVLRETGFVA
jgi:hypothetical protein